MASYNLHFEAPTQDLDYTLERDLLELQDKEEDTLSLCDLPLHDQQTEEENIPAATDSDPEDNDDFFAFPVDPVYGYYPMDILFCGKSITSSSNPNKKGVKQLNSQESFKLGHCPSHVSMQSRKTSQLVKTKSSKSHKHLIGLVKYHQQEMDLNEIRKRQGKRAPAAMFPGIGGGEGSPEVRESEGKGVMVRPLKCRSHLLNALSKVALGCIPHV